MSSIINEYENRDAVSARVCGRDRCGDDTGVVGDVGMLDGTDALCAVATIRSVSYLTLESLPSERPHVDDVSLPFDHRPGTDRVEFGLLSGNCRYDRSVSSAD